jgi:hypothetical protein
MSKYTAAAAAIVKEECRVDQKNESNPKTNKQNNVFLGGGRGLGGFTFTRGEAVPSPHPLQAKYRLPPVPVCPTVANWIHFTKCRGRTGSLILKLYLDSKPEQFIHSMERAAM